MKLALQITAAGLSALFLASCGSTSTAGGPGNHPSGTGPFDSRGNYVEDWADSPSKWKKGGGGPSKPGDSLNIVANDDVPTSSIPIPTADNTPQPGNISSTPIVSRPTPTRTASSATSSASATASRPTPKRDTSSSTASKPKPKAKSTATASKAKPKPKATARYTIKKGDTLSAIASRNGTSVSALQRANGIKGSMIQPGKSLVIPK